MPEPPAEPLPRRKGPRQQQPYPQPPVELVQSAFGPVHMTPAPPPGPPQFQAFTPVAQPASEANGGEADKPYQPLKDVSQTRRCFRQPDGRWWLRIDVTAEQMAGGASARCRPGSPPTWGCRRARAGRSGARPASWR
ncbi:hypothetical protein [Nonomuraea salmonea]|uniref:hypothetical protein n=1 Tax=Nonomuraea salmonea TaxID=46181 RepID=UPI0031EDA83B